MQTEAAGESMATGAQHRGPTHRTQSVRQLAKIFKSQNIGWRDRKCVTKWTKITSCRTQWILISKWTNFVLFESFSQNSDFQFTDSQISTFEKNKCDLLAHPSVFLQCNLINENQESETKGRKQYREKPTRVRVLFGARAEMTGWFVEI